MVAPPASLKNGKERVLATTIDDRAVPPHVPLRLCVVCRSFRPKAELFRFSKRKDEPNLIPDPTADGGGKGVYLCRQTVCLERLQKDRRLRRSIKDKLQPGGLEWMLGELGVALESKT